jgi:alginate O-acetyltransferase complex protein AlgI
MIFSSEVFLFGFLPIVLALYFAAPGNRLRNAVLIVGSLFFYFWGEGSLVLLIVGLALFNYAFALALSRLPDSAVRTRRRLLILTVAVDVATLVYFKYTGFFIGNLAFLLHGRINPHLLGFYVALPLGISFFTFHAISYAVDVYRRTSEARRNPLEVVLYFVFFPQLIAGPIIRYKDVADQLGRRVVTLDDLAYGIRRFVVGLGKKVLIADALGQSVDRIFATPPGDLSQPAAWFGVAGYALQVYFDFSGYSDMAIGLARMFGFHFLENFNFPYIAGSIREFWQRWNISLSRWMRDYLYIPLGGNRVVPWRVYLNLTIVFLVCGLWHGAKWTFVVWGLMHGCFMILERVGAVRFLTEHRILRHVYAISALCFTWVFFRSDSFEYALGFLRALAWRARAPALGLPAAVDRETIIVFVLGCILATPWLSNRIEAALRGRMGELRTKIALGLAPVGTIALFVASVAKLTAGTYSPFIYFRF